MSPDGAQLYVTRPGAFECEIIDVHSHVIVKPLQTGPSPALIAFNATGSRAIITDGQTGAVLIE